MGTADNVEVRLQYPHNPAMVPAGWQVSFDRSVALDPVGSLAMVILSAIIVIGGLLFIIGRYTSNRRGRSPVVVPEYLTEPPSNDPPALAATLLNEKSSPDSAVATMIDLAQRGYLVIEQSQAQQGLGGLIDRISENTPFAFYRTDKEQGDELRPYEVQLLKGLFPNSATTCQLSDLKDKFYITASVIQIQLDSAIVEQGYFKDSPSAVRGAWRMRGLLVAALGGGAAFVVGTTATLPSYLALLPLPFMALGIIGVLAMIAASFMPSQTAKGMQETAKWQAFRTYLRNIHKYSDLKQSSEQFDKYFGYALAFGLDGKWWIHEFSPALTSMPSWYYPTYMYGPWSGRYPTYGHMSGGFSGAANIGGGSGNGLNLSGGLNAASNNLTQGLNAMNSGLTTLLNRASATMTSRPGSSSGGFSGGGSHSGGGSGGGSSSFH